MHKAVSKALYDKQAGFPPVLLVERHWEIVAREFPVLDLIFKGPGRVPLRLQFICPEWNELPPSIALLSTDGAYLTVIPRDPGGVFNPSAHPTTGRPFICMKGSLEYHTHTSHLNDRWDAVRGHSSYDLGGIITQVWRAWRTATP